MRKTSCFYIHKNIFISLNLVIKVYIFNYLEDEFNKIGIIL